MGGYISLMTDPTDFIASATDAVFARCGGDHTRHCAWHNVMALVENWDESQAEDPTAEWCQGEPTHDYLTENALDMIDGYCQCS
jgi:hypothetical protein